MSDVMILVACDRIELINRTIETQIEAIKQRRSVASCVPLAVGLEPPLMISTQPTKEDEVVSDRLYRRAMEKNSRLKRKIKEKHIAEETIPVFRALKIQQRRSVVYCVPLVVESEPPLLPSTRPTNEDEGVSDRLYRQAMEKNDRLKRKIKAKHIAEATIPVFRAIKMLQGISTQIVSKSKRFSSAKQSSKSDPRSMTKGERSGARLYEAALLRRMRLDSMKEARTYMGKHKKNGAETPSLITIKRNGCSSETEATDTETIVSRE